jgi:REP element-mobilizing transposase RayT
VGRALPVDCASRVAACRLVALRALPVELKFFVRERLTRAAASVFLNAPEARKEGSRWQARNERCHRKTDNQTTRPGRGGRGAQMPSTHLSLHYHLVFSTKERIPSIVDEVRTRIHAYLGGIIRGLDGVPLDVGGTADHVHLVIGLKATHCLADVLRTLKGDSSRWIHDELHLTHFAWQEGYGAFTVSRSSLDSVREYVRGQEEHHRKRSFQEEYRAFLEKHEIEFDPRYLW